MGGEGASLWGFYSLCVPFPFELVRDNGDTIIIRQTNKIVFCLENCKVSLILLM